MEAARTLIFVCALIVFVAAVMANDYYQIEGPVEYAKAEKVTHLRFYLHDILSGANPTAVRVAKSNRTTDDKSPTPFGSVYAIDDHLRVGAEPNSTIIGNAQGLYLVSSQDPSKFTIVMYADFELTTGKFNGSSISVFSRNPVYLKQRDLAIVGGRGQFRMARGFVLVKTSYFNATNGDAILQYTATIYHY